MKTANIVIIGGGIVGCSLAYNLALKGVKDIVLIEKDFICAGSTGRCGGGIRQQWSTPSNIKLAMESVKIFEGLEKELDYPTEYKQGGYLIPVFKEEFVSQARKNVELQRQCGLNVEILSKEEVKKMVPALNVSDIKLATFCQKDGHANPFLVTQGYVRKARSLGVELRLKEEVKDIKVQNSEVKSVITDKEEIFTGCVVNAAGGYSGRIGNMAGLDLPVKPFRHEILVTEPVNNFFDTMIISFDFNIYFRQALHGAILMGHGTEGEPEGYNEKSSAEFAMAISKKAVYLMPVLKNVNIVRQWAGLYNVTPDAQPILGDVDEVKGYYQAIGFSGHGFMLAPRVAQIMADFIVDNKKHEIITSLSLKRFESGELVKDVNVV